MKDIMAQYIAAAAVLIMVFLLLADPKGTVQIFNALSNANTGAINALQGGSSGYMNVKQRT